MYFIFFLLVFGSQCCRCFSEEKGGEGCEEGKKVEKCAMVCMSVNKKGLYYVAGLE